MRPTIQMIPIEVLEHHPENPRKDLGDLKELIASIKESGVMQNLTVVPNPNDEEISCTNCEYTFECLQETRERWARK